MGGMRDNHNGTLGLREIRVRVGVIGRVSLRGMNKDEDKGKTELQVWVGARVGRL